VQWGKAVADSPASDWELIERYREQKEEVAFCALLIRHGARTLSWYYVERRPGLDMEEVGAAAQEGFLQAVETFNPHRGASFPTWAKRCVRSRKLDVLRALDNKSRRLLVEAVHLDSPVGGSGDKESDTPGDFHEVVPDPEVGDPLARVIQREEIRERWGSLTWRECQVLAGELNGRTPEQTAVALGWKKGSGDNALQRARCKFGQAPGEARHGSRWAIEMMEANGADRRAIRPRRRWVTRTSATAGVKGWGAMRKFNLKQGRDTSRGGMPWPPTQQREAAPAVDIRRPDQGELKERAA
jgi:DNA-directed RNA polymerase specialized sigma24 family protein